MHARVLIAICILLATATVAQSRRWLAPEVDRWITQETVPASWEDAKRRCERDGAVLASPLNTQVHNYLKRINNDSVAYFIGTRATRSGGRGGQKVHYASVEGTRLDDMPMAVFFEIMQLNHEQGDCLSMDRDGIHAVSCLDHLPYICYSNTSLGYTYYAATGSAYKFHHERFVSWDEANTTCAGEGAHVLELNDAREADIVAGIVGNAGYCCTWTGLRDNRPGGVMEWRTVHGEPLSDVYHQWAGDRPYNDARYTCTYFYTPYKRLVDTSCTTDNNYITCEISYQ